MRTFASEIAVHFPKPEGLGKPMVWLVPDVVLCLNCGVAEFVVPEAELRLLSEGPAAPENPRRRL